MYASLRVYSIAPDAYAAVGRAFMDGLVNPICNLEGFQAYILAGGGERVYSLSVFDTQDHAEYSNTFARNWVEKNLHETIPVPPDITVGRIAVARYTAGFNRQNIRYIDHDIFK